MSNLLTATKYASQGKLGELEKIFFSDTDYYVSCDEFSPHSAWSILLVCLPETTPAAQYKHLVTRLHKKLYDTKSSGLLSIEPVEDNEEAELQVKEYIHQECQRRGWTAATHQNIDWYSLWLKLRIELVDRYCGESQLLQPDWIYVLLDDAPPAGLEWYRGIANVVIQYRHITKEWVYIADFEQADPKKNVETLLASSKSNFDTAFQLCKDFLDYMGNWDPLQDWIRRNYTNIRLLSNIPATYNDGIDRDLIAACILNVDPDWAAVRTIISRVTEGQQDGDQDSTGEQDETQSHIQAVDAEDFAGLAAKVSLSNKFLAALQNAVSISSVLDVPLRTILLASHNSVEDSKQLATAYIKNDTIDWIQLEPRLSTLLAVFKLVDQDWARRLILKHSLATGRFDIVQAHFADDTELENLALEQFRVSFEMATNPSPRNVHLIQARTCIDMCSNPTSVRVVQARAQMTSVADLARHSVKLRPAQIVGMPVMDVVDHALHQDASLYKDFDTCYAIASMLDSTVDDQDVKLLCVQRALSKLDFDTAYKYAVDDDDVTWPILLEVGNYASSQSGYSLDRLSQVLSLQTDLLAHVLQTCPQSRLVEVLSVWKCRDMELKDTLQELKTTPSPSATPALASFPNAAAPLKNLLASSQSQSPSPSPLSEGNGTSGIAGHRKRDQFSSILKSGIGWMVGASEQDMA